MNFHDKKVIAASLRGLGEVGSLESKSRLFIFLHGAFMLAAWVCSASLGIIMARYNTRPLLVHTIIILA